MTLASFTKANRNLQRAIARGDVDTAVQWTLVICRQIQTARSLTDLATTKLQPKRRREKPKAEAAPASSLTQYSPGGTPNWFLNQQRLERAGLPLDLAPKTKACRS
ncbi:MAG: hypothetical protein EOO70_09115 [Myxococcaceae bacterium]|nr:MAG: hypothetical protein EOO70_09115 [Myxococcaceae bacterium]